MPWCETLGKSFFPACSIDAVLTRRSAPFKWWACRDGASATETSLSDLPQIESLKANLAYELAEKESILAEALEANASLERKGLGFERDCDRLRAELIEVVTSDTHGAFERERLKRKVWPRKTLTSEIFDDLDEPGTTGKHTDGSASR